MVSHSSATSNKLDSPVARLRGGLMCTLLLYTLLNSQQVVEWDEAYSSVYELYISTSSRIKGFSFYLRSYDTSSINHDVVATLKCQRIMRIYRRTKTHSFRASFICFSRAFISLSSVLDLMTNWRQTRLCTETSSDSARGWFLYAEHDFSFACFSLHIF